MKITINKFYLIIIIILLIVIAISKFKDKEVVKPTILYEYKTDSTYIKKYFALKKKYDNVTPPEEVIKWLKPSKPENIVVEKIPDSIILYIKELENKLVIPDSYLTTSPSASKLLEFNLTKKNFDIILIDTDGYVTTQEYPINLDNYNYQWYENSLHNSPYETAKVKIKRRLDLSQLYINTSYDYLHKYNTLGLDYSIKLGRLKFGIDSRMIIQDHPEKFRVDLILGYKLFR